MAEQAAQSYKSHRMYVPGFHFVAFGILVINFVWTLYRVFSGGGPVADNPADFRRYEVLGIRAVDPGEVEPGNRVSGEGESDDL